MAWKIYKFKTYDLNGDEFGTIDFIFTDELRQWAATDDVFLEEKSAVTVFNPQAWWEEKLAYLTRCYEYPYSRPTATKATWTNITPEEVTNANYQTYKYQPKSVDEAFPSLTPTSYFKFTNDPTQGYTYHYTNGNSQLRISNNTGDTPSGNNTLLNVDAGSQYGGCNSYYVLFCTDINDPINTMVDHISDSANQYNHGGELKIGRIGGTFTSSKYRVNYFTNPRNNTYDQHFKEDLRNYGEIEGVTTPDPLEPGGISGPGGAGGDFDATSDTIGVPSLPSLSAIDTGLLSAYAPDITEIRQLAAFLWDTSLDWTNVEKVINEPIKTIFGFSILPFTPDTGTPRTVKLGNMTSIVQMAPITNQWKEIDCGELAINEYWGSYLDYGGYTDIKIYLPYIGIVPVDTDDVMGRTLKIVYHCDCISGACVAYVLSNGSQIATYNGQISANVPLTSNDFANTINGVLGLAGNVGSLVASGGASAASSIAGMASNAMNAMKPNVQKSGALAGTGGIMGTQYPFLIAQRPRQSLPEGYNKIEGYPSNISAVLGTLHGYTKIEQVEFEGLNATEAEKDEIKAMLQAGVIL